MPNKKAKKKPNTKKDKTKIIGYYWDGVKSYVLRKSRNILGI